jgi:hypothetical protein
LKQEHEILVFQLTEQQSSKELMLLLLFAELLMQNSREPDDLVFNGFFHFFE